MHHMTDLPQAVLGAVQNWTACLDHLTKRLSLVTRARTTVLQNAESDTFMKMQIEPFLHRQVALNGLAGTQMNES